MSQKKKYWKGIEQLEGGEEFADMVKNEFAEPIPVDEFLADESVVGANATTRRDFLKFFGFSIAAASLAACETPVINSIPYLVKPEEITPGEPLWYASTYADGVDYCSILVKTREGRPIHIEGNKMSNVTKGGINARVNSSVLSLYDTSRLKEPMVNSFASSWDAIDKEIPEKLRKIAAEGGTIAMLSSTIISPTTKEVINEFGKTLQGYRNDVTEGNINSNAGKKNNKPTFRHITYDAVSYSALSNANNACFNKEVIPDYRFDKAKVIVSFGADFLSTWLSPIEYASQYGSRRNPDNDWMSRHYQFETTLSLTGSNADIRGAIKPSEQGLAALHLYNLIALKSGGVPVEVKPIEDDNDVMSKLKSAAEDLWNARGATLVVCGVNDESIQSVINAINYLLGNYNKTIDLNTTCNLRQGNDEEVKEFIDEMNTGDVQAILIYGCNPVYSMPEEWNFSDALQKVKLKISFADRLDETALQCNYVCPDHHYLESWNDANPKTGHYSLTQPVISPLYKTRQVQETLLKWSGVDQDYHSYLKNAWLTTLYKPERESDAELWWNTALHNGVLENISFNQQESNEENALEILVDMKEVPTIINELSDAGDWELQLYMKTGIGEGNHANNPWLQELPDPVSRVTWDNYITMNPDDMKGIYNINTGQKEKANMARLSVATPGISREIILPVIALPGQRRKTVGIALGYGRTSAGRVGNGIGENAYSFVHFVNNTLHYSDQDIKIEPTSETYPIGSVQTHHTMMGRRIILETDIESYNTISGDDKKSGWNKPVIAKNAYGRETLVKELDLWEPHDVETVGHRWGMNIDLNACIACGSCVTSCTSENNVPVVGKDEIIRNREMHWIRIDRYYSSDANKKDNSYKEMEDSSVYPEVAFQPVMCHHCNHAPCETVCPVAATTHSDEGLNQMTYNRCIGTRYCMNNCPYKVRRFNWFNYNRYKKFADFNPSHNDLGKMVLNPDVVVRSRGVMEKCSLCIQRIQKGKLNAKKDNRPVLDGEIKTACASACPTNAITFGDVNDKKSQIKKLSENKRAYHLLEEVGVQPNIWFMVRVKNKNKTNNA